MSAQPATSRPTSRDIARAAVRAQLSQTAYELVRAEGFENVTIDDMAEASGVSRTTFLRYFPTKDQAVLSALETHADWVGAALRARPAHEDDWTALRRAIEAMIPYYLTDTSGALAMTRMILHTPALSGARFEMRQDWRAALTRTLADRAGLAEPAPISLRLKVAAALECLSLAVDDWADANGDLDLVDLIDQGFAVLGAGDVTAASQP